MGGDGTIVVLGVAIWTPTYPFLASSLTKRKKSLLGDAQPRFETPPNCFVTKLINWLKKR